MRKMLYIYPTAFEDVRTGFVMRFWQALQCWRYGDTGAALFHWTLGWDRLLNRGYYEPGGAIDQMFDGWRSDGASQMGARRRTSKRDEPAPATGDRANYR